MNISIRNADLSQILLLKPLWLGLRDYHISLSGEVSSNNFDERVKKIKEKAQNGVVNILLAFDQDKQQHIGYCISSISNKNQGELDSLYVMDEYRGLRIGESLMENSMAWFQQNKVEHISILVMYENENALNFYKKAGFSPKSYLLKKHL